MNYFVEFLKEISEEKDDSTTMNFFLLYVDLRQFDRAVTQNVE